MGIDDLSPFFNAKGVAVIGASSKPNKLSYGILKNLASHGYNGAIYPVNPGTDEILGLKTYPSISDVPDPVELAVIVLPAQVVLEQLEACGKRGIKAVVIITGGFKEIGESGKALETEGLAIARRYGMRIVGPNCVGTLDTRTGLNSTFIKGMPVPGPIAFISQSGAICGGVIDLILQSKIGFSHFASLGNEMDVTETDMLAYFGADPDIKVIAMYIEGIVDGQRFMQTAKEVSRAKPIVFLKAGRNDAGARAVSSHTGSLAGSYTAYQAALEQNGVVEVSTINELFNLAWALGTQPLPKGNRVGITTNAGGAAALAADSLFENGFTLASISKEIQDRLRTRLNPAAQVQNPVDMLGSVTPEDYSWSLGNLQDDPGVDVLLPILVPQALVDTAGVAQAWAEVGRNTQKTLLTCLMGRQSTAEAEVILNLAGVPVYPYPDQAGPVLRGMLAYQRTLARPESEPVAPFPVDRQKLADATAAVGDKMAVGEFETRLMLESYGIRSVPGALATSVDEAVRIAEEIGYPIVLKIAAEGLLHKSEAGGIVLNIQDAETLREAFNALRTRIQQTYPQYPLQGIMVENMAEKGQEVIVGMRRDETFGPLLMFGMGGTMVELVKDIAFKVAPVSEVDIEDMFAKTVAGKLLAGFRGSKPLDTAAVKDVILRLSQLALENPRLKEIEINPLIVYPEGEGALALDSRAILH